MCRMQVDLEGISAHITVRCTAAKSVSLHLIYSGLESGAAVLPTCGNEMVSASSCGLHWGESDNPEAL